MNDICMGAFELPKTQAMLDKHKELSSVIDNLNLDAKTHNKFVGEMVEYVSWLHMESWRQGLEFGLKVAEIEGENKGNITRVDRRKGGAKSWSKGKTG
jgi:hypothetical protein